MLQSAAGKEFCPVALRITAQGWAYAAAARAVVATPAFVGVLHRSGRREYVPWQGI